MVWFRRFLRPETALFLLLWLGLLLAGRSRMLRDPGTFWHPAVGERILTTGTFPTTDEYSFTHAGQPWIAHQWLGEVTLALLGRWGNLDLSLLVAVTILAGLWTFVGVRLLRCGLHWSVAFSLVAVGLVVSAGHFHVRPHLATMVLFALLLAGLIDVEAGRVPFARLWWLVPVFLLWTNLHGGMLGGFATLGLTLVGWATWAMFGWPSPLATRRDAMLAVLLLVCCGATAFVNPYGAEQVRTWLRIIDMPELKQIIQEHAMPDWLSADGLGILVLGAGYLALLISTLPDRPRVVWGLPLVWGLLALDRVRQAPLFALAALLCLADLFVRTRLAKRLQDRGSDLFVPPPPTPPTIAPMFPLALVVLLVAACLPIRYAQLDPERCPIELLPELLAHQHDRPEGTRIFNPLNDGGFLIRYTPGYRVFVDDRCELYGGQWLSNYVHYAGRQSRSGFDDWDREYGFDVALIVAGSTLDQHLKGMPEMWREIRRTQTRVLYVRQEKS